MTTTSVPTTSLPLQAIHRNPTQPRGYFDEEALQELATNMNQFGLLQPIIVRPFPCDCEDGQHYQIIAGERRKRSAEMLGWDSIDCRVLINVTDQDAYVMALSENFARKDMLPSELARGFVELVRMGYTHQQIGDMIGHTALFVEMLIGMLTMCDEAIEAADRGETNSTSTSYIARLSHDGQRECLRKLRNGEFVNQQALQRYAHALRQLELNPELRAQAHQQPTEIMQRNQFEEIWGRISRMERTFQPLFTMLPTELNDSLVRDAQSYLEELDHLIRVVRRAQVALQQAIGAAEVANSLDGFPTLRVHGRVRMPDASSDENPG